MHFHSHIRKANPRRDDNDKKHIKARRGIPYGRRDVSTEIDPSIPQMPNDGVGLLFMSFQKSITNQFEFIQTKWVNEPDFPKKNDGIDPIIGQDGVTNKSTGKFAQKYDSKSSLESQPFDQFVHLKGGEYFFAPSIAFLKK